ncbi:MAG: DegV family protein [Anaerolineales bacterium]|nr:DegV family protein [Anaerolineales bacterium]
MSIAVVTDSTADIPSELAQEYQIQVVPNLVIIEGESLEDGKDISRQEFYERLPTMETPPTTATASIGAYQQLYEKLLGGNFKQIISIHASSQLSGIFNAASTAAQAFGDRVNVLDSEQISMGLGFQALAAAEAVAHGEKLEAALSLIRDVRRRLRVVAMLDTLEYVRRSGRVSWARARLGNLLRIKPFLEVSGGSVFSLGESRTRRKGVERLVQFLQELGALERLAILHTNAEDEALQFLANINPQLPTIPLVVNVTTVIGVHVGPNGLGFAAVLKF